MSVIASLVANFKADTVDFDTKVKRSANGLRSFETQAKSVSAGVTSAFMKLSAVVGGISLFRSSITDASKYGELAEVLGDSAKNMQALSYAASQNDSNFEAASNAMVKMQKNISEAANGNKQLGETFDRLGLSTSKLLGMSATEQFKAISDALSGVSNQATKTNIGMDIFGKSFASIAVLVGAGSQAIDEASRNMKAFGLSDEQIEKVKQFEDRLRGFEIQVKSTAAKVVSAFGDEMLGAIDDLSTAITNSIEFWSDLDSSTKEWIKTGLKAALVAYALNKAMVFDAIAKGVQIVFSLASAWRAYATATKAAAIGQVALQNAKLGWAGIATAAAQVAALGAAMYGLSKAFDKATESTAELNGNIDEQAESMRVSLGAHIDAASAIDSETDAIKKQAQALREVDQLLNKYRDDTRKMIGYSEADIDIEKMRDNGATPEQIAAYRQSANINAGLKLNQKASDLIRDAQDETTRLTKGEVELKLIEAQRLGLTQQQIFALRNVLEYNERVKKSQEAQKDLTEMQKRNAEDDAKNREDVEKRIAEERQKDSARLQAMKEEASPELKFAIDKGELDRLKADLGMDDKTYNFQLNKLKDDLKKNLGIDLDAGKMPKQATMESTRTGMLTYALMGGKVDEDKADRKQMLEYQRIIAEAVRNQGRLGFNN